MDEVSLISCLGRESLISSHATYNALGVRGKALAYRACYEDYVLRTLGFTSGDGTGALSLPVVSTGDFKDQSLLADIESEVAIINLFRASRLPVRVFSEELGETLVGSIPQFFAVIDGLDGTSHFVKHGPFEGKQVTMLGIYSGVNPSYDDYLFSGAIQHASRKLFYSVKGSGAYVEDLRTGYVQRIFASDDFECLDEKTPLSADLGFDSWAGITVLQDYFLSKLEGFKVVDPQVSACNYLGVALGVNALGFECTRGDKKMNLETAAAYGLVKEAGGLVVDSQGGSLGSRNFLEFGHGPGEHFPIIIGANPKIVRSLLDTLNA